MKTPAQNIIPVIEGSRSSCGFQDAIALAFQQFDRVARHPVRMTAVVVAT